MLQTARPQPRTPGKVNSQGASMNLLISILYDWSRVVAGYLTWAGPLAVRIVVGWVFMWTGWQKLHFLPRMIENFREWGDSRTGDPDALRLGDRIRWRPAAAGRASDSVYLGSNDDHHARCNRFR